MAECDSDSDGSFVPPPPPAPKAATVANPAPPALLPSRPSAQPPPIHAPNATKPQPQPPRPLSQPQLPRQPPIAIASNNSSSAVAKKPAAAPGAGRSNNNLMSSLLSKLESTDKMRQAISQLPQSVLTKQTEVKSRFEVWEAEVKTRLLAFYDDERMTELRFEMGLDKEAMYILHDLVTDHSDLVSANVGQYEERHVVVYRKGHQPADVEAPGCAPAPPEMQQRLQARKAAAFKNASALAQAPPQLETKLVKIGGEKRDRRTIGEIQEEILKRRRPEATE